MARWYERKSSTGKGLNGRKIIILLVVIAGVFLLLRSGINYFKMKGQRDSLKQEISDLTKKNGQLTSKTANLYNDKEYIEKAAREQLNLAKDGETVIIIKDDK